MDVDIDFALIRRSGSEFPFSRARSAARAARRVGFVLVVTISTTIAFLVAGMPAWVFAVITVVLAGALWLCCLELGDQRLAIADVQHDHAMELHELRRQHQVRTSTVISEARAARDEFERLLADVRSPEGEEQARVLEYRFRRAFGRLLRDLERRGYSVRVEGEPPIVRVYGRDEIKAEVALRQLLPPPRGHHAPFAQSSRSGPVSFEPSLERL